MFDIDVMTTQNQLALVSSFNSPATIVGLAMIIGLCVIFGPPTKEQTALFQSDDVAMFTFLDTTVKSGYRGI